MVVDNKIELYVFVNTAYSKIIHRLLFSFPFLHGHGHSISIEFNVLSRCTPGRYFIHSIQMGLTFSNPNIMSVQLIGIFTPKRIHYY